MSGLKKFLNENHKLREKSLSNSDHSKELYRHRWYYFKEGFSPLIVEEGIREANLKKDDLIVDPFAGSGTTSIVASAHGFEGIGFEINPFMSFVAKTKQSMTTAKVFKNYQDNVLFGIDKGYKSELENISTFSETKGKEKWLFNTEVIRAFEGGWRRAETLPCEIRNLYRLLLIASAMDNANASKDGKCLRYKKNWQGSKYGKESFFDTFRERAEMLESDLENCPISKNKAKIIQGDSRLKLRYQIHKPFKLCITSPPYLNSFDYCDIYRPELFLGKFITGNEDLKKLRLKTIRSHVQVNWPAPKKSNFGYLYKQVMADLAERREFLWNKKIPIMIQAYFEDMGNIFLDLKKNAQKDASFWLIVSTSAYAGIEIPVDLILAEIGSRIGWNLEEIVVLRYLRNSTQNAKRWLSGEAYAKRLRESMILFKGFEK